MPPAAPLHPDDPAWLGPYRLTGRLGEGGQGVFLGTDATGGPVVVKVFREIAPDARARLRREVTAARQVAPACTAPIVDAEVGGPVPYVVSEYVDGPSLGELIRVGGPLTGADLDHLAVNMMTALAAIHEAGIAHGDFRAANVLVAADGPCVAGFGVTQGMNGTGAPAVPAADMFAWAATMVFAATGRSPFDTPSEVSPRIAEAAPDLDVSAELRTLIARSLDPDPSQRPAARHALRSLRGPDAIPETSPAPARSTRSASGAYEPGAALTPPQPSRQQQAPPAAPSTSPDPAQPRTARHAASVPTPQPPNAAPNAPNDPPAAYDRPQAYDGPQAYDMPQVYDGSSAYDAPPAYDASSARDPARGYDPHSAYDPPPTHDPASAYDTAPNGQAPAYDAPPAFDLSRPDAGAFEFRGRSGEAAAAPAAEAAEAAETAVAAGRGHASRVPALVGSLVLFVLIVGGSAVAYALTRTPGTSTGPSASSQAIPAAFTGTWSGTVNQTRPTTASRRTVLKLGPTGSSISYPDNGCTGAITVVSTSTNRLVLQQTLGSGSCPQAGYLTLIRSGAALQADFSEYLDGSSPTAAGRLARP